jgi:hypothetical protein
VLSLTLLPVLLLAAGPSRAAADEESSKVRLGLYLEYEHFSYLAGTGGNRVDNRNALTAIPQFDWTPVESFHLRSSALLRQDFSEEERSRASLYDTFASFERESWALKIGRQFITWGRADSLRPTDVFKRHDLTDLIENKEEPTDAVKLDLVRGAWTLEGVWAPVFDPDIVSFRPENRWTGLPTTADVPNVGQVDLIFREDPRQRPTANLGSGQVGLRLSGSAGGWDFAGMYYYGYDRVPTVVKREIGNFDPVGRQLTVTLAPIHKRIHVFGGDAATAISGWGLRAEAAYTLTSDLAPGTSGTNDPYFRFTGGVDRTFTRLPIGESLWVIVQYAVDTHPRQPGPVDSQEVDPRLHPFQHALVVNSAWKYTEFVRLNFKAYANLLQGDYVLRPEISWQPIDSLTVVVGGDVLGGGSKTFFGTFRDNDRIRFRVSHAF